MATLTENHSSTTPYKALIRRPDYRSISRQFKTKKARGEWVRMVEGQMDQGVWLDPRDEVAAQVADGTFGDLIHKYVDHLGWPFTKEERETGRTRDLYSRCTALRKAAREIGHLYPNQLSVEYVWDYAEERAATGTSPRTLLGLWKNLSKVVRYARTRLRVEFSENVFAETHDELLDQGIIGKANERDRRLEYVYDYTYTGSNPEYYGQTFEKIHEYDLLMIELAFQDHYLVDIIDFALASTMRASHIMRIRFSDMDLEDNIIRRMRKIDPRGKGKNDIWEEGVLPPAAIEIVRRVQEKRAALPALEELDRQELYRRVWEEPVSVVCHEYDLSDNGLRKKLKRLNIPFPNQGYWQAKKRGAEVSHLKPKLPAMGKRDQDAIGDLLFPFPGSGRAAAYAFNEVCKKLGLEGLTFHILRHEGVSRLVEDPKRHDYELIMAVTGHHSESSMKRYTHLRPGHQRRKWGDAIDRL